MSSSPSRISGKGGRTHRSRSEGAADKDPPAAAGSDPLDLHQDEESAEEVHPHPHHSHHLHHGPGGGNSSPPPSSALSSHHSQDVDLYSILSGMGHLSAGGGGGGGGHQAHQVAAAAHAAAAAAAYAHHQHPNPHSRKRKFLEQHGAGGGPGGGSGKMNGMKPPFLRRSSEDEDEAQSVALHTPQCSQSGYADEEDRHHHAMESAATVAAAAAAAQAAAAQQHLSNHPAPPSIGSSSLRGRVAPSASGGILSPSVHHLISEIDDNLASNFDDSLSGLGVDIASANYSMSEALLALPNLSISSSQVKKYFSPARILPLGTSVFREFFPNLTEVLIILKLSKNRNNYRFRVPPQMRRTQKKYFCVFYYF